MDLHKDLESFRLAQRVLRKEEVTDRVLDVVNQDARRVDDYISALNASQVGMRTPTQLRHQFYLGDERVMSRLIPMVYDNRDEMLMASNSGDILDMYEWHKGAGNTDLHSFIVAHNDFSKQYAQQFARAPEVPPYAAELDINRYGQPNNDFGFGRPDQPGGNLPVPSGASGALPFVSELDDRGDEGNDNAALGTPPVSQEEAVKRGKEAEKAYYAKYKPTYLRLRKEIMDTFEKDKAALARSDPDYEARVAILKKERDNALRDFDQRFQANGTRAANRAYQQARGLPLNERPAEAPPGYMAGMAGPRADAAAVAAGYVNRGQEMRNEAVAGRGGDAENPVLVNAELAQDAGGLGERAAELLQNREAQANSQVLGQPRIEMEAARLAGERGVAPNPAAPDAGGDNEGVQAHLAAAMDEAVQLGVRLPPGVQQQFDELLAQRRHTFNPDGLVLPVLRYDPRGAPRELSARERVQQNAMVDAGRIENMERGDAQLLRNAADAPAAAAAAAQRLEDAMKAALERQVVLRDAAAQRIREGRLDLRPGGGRPNRPPAAAAPVAAAPAPLPQDMRDQLVAAVRELRGLGLPIPPDMQQEMERMGIAGAPDDGPVPGAGAMSDEQRLNQLQAAAAQYVASGQEVPLRVQQSIDAILMRRVMPAVGRGHPNTPSKGVKRTLAPHQVKGSEAAKKHMADLRAKRAKK